jgi:hypothetical protein
VLATFYPEDYLVSQILDHHRISFDDLPLSTFAEATADKERTNWGGKDRGKQRMAKRFKDIFYPLPFLKPKAIRRDGFGKYIRPVS